MFRIFQNHRKVLSRPGDTVVTSVDRSRDYPNRIIPKIEGIVSLILVTFILVSIVMMLFQGPVKDGVELIYYRVSADTPSALPVYVVSGGQDRSATQSLDRSSRVFEFVFQSSGDAYGQCLSGHQIADKWISIAAHGDAFGNIDSTRSDNPGMGKKSS
ncbi:MAG: hypothetical protein WD075_06290 [Rhodospirillales bacterium]